MSYGLVRPALDSSYILCSLSYYVFYIYQTSFYIYSIYAAFHLDTRRNDFKLLVE